MKQRILVIDDDVLLCKLLAAHLGRADYDVIMAHNGREGLKLAYETHPDLVILDVNMPDIDGFETCRRLRELSDVAIIMVTARAEESDAIKGLRLGADDYIRKPVSLGELEERIRAIQRRRGQQERQNRYLFDDGALRIDVDRLEVWRHGQLVHLTPTEYRLLVCLALRQGRVARHEELLSEVWGPGYDDATACLSLYIRYLREKLEDDPKDPKYIQTRWGIGYSFAPIKAAA